MQQKIKCADELCPLLDLLRKEGKRIVQCHGVFDLMHVGHVKHLQEAKQQGDALVVSITADRFVNKGPGRPAFTETLRLEQIAALACVDFVVLSQAPDAVPMIRSIRPHVYVKGVEYQNHAADVTGKISEETKAVEEGGGKIHYTNDVVFSSSTLLNRYFDPDADRLKHFLDTLKEQMTLEDILQKIEALSTLNVLVVGDAIIDEYQYVVPLGQSGKGVHMTARCLEKETFLGGSLIIANHLAAFAKSVTLLTAIGEKCPHTTFIKQNLNSKVTPSFIYSKHFPTLSKKRYVLKDGKSLTKLFETYSSNDPLLDAAQTEQACSFIANEAPKYDLVLVCDFGNGFTNAALTNALSNSPAFLAINTQTNGGNRGFNVITHYHRADFVSINEPELRLAAQDRTSRVDSLAHDMMEWLHCPEMSITRGVEGVHYYTDKGTFSIPALTTHAVDRVGAGDCYFALAALSAAKRYPSILSGFLGSVAAAIDVQIVGNRESISKAGVCKYVTRLLK